MTTIILTIIGILLAAAAALMVIFYGGDAFNGGSIGAQANTYQNAGTNVIAAVQLAKADGFAYTTLASLTGTATPALVDDDYLKEVVALPNGSTGTLSGNVYTAVITGADAARVCARVNTNLKLATVPTTLNQATFKMGCITDLGASTFFANA